MLSEKLVRIYCFLILFKFLEKVQKWLLAGFEIVLTFDYIVKQVNVKCSGFVFSCRTIC